MGPPGSNSAHGLTVCAAFYPGLIRITAAKEFQMCFVPLCSVMMRELDLKV